LFLFELDGHCLAKRTGPSNSSVANATALVRAAVHDPYPASARDRLEQQNSQDVRHDPLNHRSDASLSDGSNRPTTAPRTDYSPVPHRQRRSGRWDRRSCCHPHAAYRHVRNFYPHQRGVCSNPDSAQVHRGGRHDFYTASVCGGRRSRCPLEITLEHEPSCRPFCKSCVRTEVWSEIADYHTRRFRFCLRSRRVGTQASPIDSSGHSQVRPVTSIGDPLRVDRAYVLSAAILGSPSTLDNGLRCMTDLWSRRTVAGARWLPRSRTGRRAGDRLCQANSSPPDKLFAR